MGRVPSRNNPLEKCLRVILNEKETADHSDLLPVVGLSVGPVARRWVEPPGTGWGTLQVPRQNTDTKFGIDGNWASFKLEDRARPITTTVRFAGAFSV